MNIIESIRLVYNNMIEKKGRVFLTLTGIIIGIFTFTFFIFVSQGLSNAITEQFNSVGLNILGVQKAGNSQGPGGDGITDTDVAKVKQVVRNYQYVAPGTFYTAPFEYGREKQFVVSLAYPDQYVDDVIQDLDIEIEEGRELRAGDRGSITLGYKIAKEAFEKEIRVGSSLKIGEDNFRVIGIGKERGDLFIDNAIFMNYDDIKKVSGQDTYSVIRIKFKDGTDLDFYKEAIENKLNPNKDEKEYSVTSSAQAIEQFNQILGLLTAIIVFISSIALLVGGINVMNTMYSNVIERINEISVMKALGATNSDIRNLFLIESSVLGILGAIIGFMSSFSLAKIVSIAIESQFGYVVPIYFDIVFFIEVILVTAFLAMSFGTYPAVRASHINPADNLKDE